MTPIYQTRFGPKHGNCMQAAIASILDLPIESAPDFAQALTMDVWNEKLDRFLKTHGFVRVTLAGDFSLECYHFAAGPSPRTPEVNHVVIRFGHAIVHDPHPDGQGLNDITEVEYLIPIDPAANPAVQRLQEACSKSLHYLECLGELTGDSRAAMTILEDALGL